MSCSYPQEKYMKKGELLFPIPYKVAENFKWKRNVCL